MITCSICGYDKNPEGTEFCEACGSELQSQTKVPPESQPPIIIQPPQQNPWKTTPAQPLDEPLPITLEQPQPQPFIPPTPPITNTALIAKLIAKQADAPVPEFWLDHSNLIGIFDPDMGPVDIDLEPFVGNETVSRHHAEIYREGGQWKIKDLGSTNGVFIKPAGKTRFNAKITRPETINPGDEIAIAKIRFLFQSP
ncbi:MULTISPECIES: FHA domain-containing protein [Moorena]|uniref:FHA domain-containing protein n=2 Tax=Moorena TaxID=1155738 RepID=F4XPT3_9CYAN|nr:MULTISPECIES: FHA domain-containing protein [Moorena]NES46762.1 FHA domain-containing protein [Moorena sp. SIO2C4]EGJ33401.1 FHA domain-containing protein [Moorena producens 3L]NEP36309.1 FHA domain-containing protein [Moorena sp. SIO3B2]NEP66274.1 FHA domain-containing protein [Moorena sp. SIO3A5]NER88014.1 FHA domain-containing protein [Moorena sp. SIO3A2]